MKEYDTYTFTSKSHYNEFAPDVEMKFTTHQEEDVDEVEQNRIKVANMVINNINSDPFINKMKTVVKNKALNDSELSGIEEDNKFILDNNKNIKTAFFLRPYLTFTLSETSKEKFIRDVDRTNASQKYVSLVNFADYCLYEMVVNRHLISDSDVKHRLANINYFMIEIISYTQYANYKH